MGLILTQEETGRHVRMLTHEIRSTLDIHTILKTTLVELGRTLGLEECSLWMPLQIGMTLCLSHALQNLTPVGSSVSMNLPVIAKIFNNPGVVRISHTCPLVSTRPIAGRYLAAEVVIVHVPLLILSNFQIIDWPDVLGKTYAMMVLVLPSDGLRKFCEHELELIEVVADQMPRGIPVATIAINNATNAGLLAVRILGSSDPSLQARMGRYLEDQQNEVLDKANMQEKEGWEAYLNP